MVYTPFHPAFFDTNPEYHEKIVNWFVLIPEEKIEMGFKTEDEFLDYLGEIGIGEFKWLNPDDLSLQFDETGCLPWVPGCETKVEIPNQ